MRIEHTEANQEVILPFVVTVVAAFGLVIVVGLAWMGIGAFKDMIKRDNERIKRG